MNCIGLLLAEGDNLHAWAFERIARCVLAIARDCGIDMSYWLVVPSVFVGAGRG